MNDQAELLKGLLHAIRTEITVSNFSSYSSKKNESLERLIDRVDFLQKVNEEEPNFATTSTQSLAELATRPFDTASIKINGVAVESEAISSDATLLSVAIIELLDNAQKYGTETTLEFQEETEFLKIIVSNQGAIEPEVLDHLYAPFVRSPNGSSGHGLGIYITKIISNKLHGQFTIENHAQEVKATLQLPITAR